jgi:uncharacterized protein (TIGR00369 family)
VSGVRYSLPTNDATTVASVASRQRWEPRDPDYRSAVATVFDQQAAMRLIGAELAVVEPGHVEILVPIRDDLTQQHGFMHGGMVALALDAACAFSIATLFPPGHSGLTIGFDVKYLAGAAGSALVAAGDVVRVGRSIAVASGSAYAVNGEDSSLSAIASETLNHFPARA